MTQRKSKTQKSKQPPQPVSSPALEEAQKSAELSNSKVSYSSVMRERRVGAPTKYNPDFHPSSYIELSALGKTRTQIAAAWDIDTDTLVEWSKDKQKKPEFSVAVKKGNALRTSWWTNHAMSLANGANKKGNTIMTIFLMKNICPDDFRDRPEVSDDNSIEDITFGDDE